MNNINDVNAKNIYILLDTSYFIFYRYYALVNWWKLAMPEVPLGNPIENEDFVSKFTKTCINKIKEMPKKLKLKLQNSNIKNKNKNKNIKIIASLDCPRHDIWRNTIYDNYKETRIYSSDFLGGPFFKLGINIIKEMNIPTFRHNSLEADDINALICKHLLNKYNNIMIYIIASDMDYLQLVSEKVKIMTLQYKDITTSKHCSGNAEFDLFTKIITGDKSDNISPVFKKCGHSTIVNYFNNRTLFEEQLKAQGCEDIYKRNKKLVDFNEIPEDLVLEFMTTLTSDANITL
jgi:5'-3' exonuclease